MSTPSPTPASPTPEKDQQQNNQNKQGSSVLKIIGYVALGIVGAIITYFTVGKIYKYQYQKKLMNYMDLEEILINYIPFLAHLHLQLENRLYYFIILLIIKYEEVLFYIVYHNYNDVYYIFFYRKK